MTGTEIMEVCKTQTDCEKCSAQKECRHWKAELIKGIEPCDLGVLIDEKEF